MNTIKAKWNMPSLYVTINICGVFINQDWMEEPIKEFINYGTCY